MRRPGGPVHAARMAGSSIAAPSAAGWVTDFLNAAFNARAPTSRDVDDLRLAFSILTTYWHRIGRRLVGRDLEAFHAAFGASRRRHLQRFEAPTLDRSELMAGATRLFEPTFSDAYGDSNRTGWGVVFADAAARVAYRPESRMRRAPLGPLTPPLRPPSKQRWHIYPPVRLPSAAAALKLLEQPSRWPEFGSSIGRFTSLRAGGLDGQTFEIEVAASPTAATPIFTRGYVTATRLLRRSDDAPMLDAYVRQLREAMAVTAGSTCTGPVPDDGIPTAALELTTHEGHFIGRAVSRLVIYEHRRSAYLRDVGSWDPMPPHLALSYRVAGQKAQSAFWGGPVPDESMLHQLALKAR